MKFSRTAALAVLLFLPVTQTALAAQGGHMAMAHANPMPNLMQVINRHADQLNLTDEQAAALTDWRKNHMDPMHAQVKQVVQMEQDLYAASMAGKSKAELMGLANKILQQRRDVISTKIDCRDNMQRILSPEQFAKVLAIYQK
ncbi:MAG: Spy/CpxP family protein refolding chaperone [Chromatiales bacterium]|jgi:Spy/CpxP family protein refolding chaperone